MTVAETVKRLFELLVQVWLPPSFTALFRVTVPELPLIVTPPVPRLNAVPESVRLAVAVLPSPTVMPAMPVVP